jgi:DMSO/TMAO reductase YedYZ molybdopterin-dependent catalytic subunit
VVEAVFVCLFSSQKGRFMETTTLRIGGEVATPRQFSFDDLAALPHQIPDIGVLAPGRQGCAVPLRTLLDETGVSERATHITLYADDGNYSASVPLAEVIDHAVIIYGLDHQPLPAEQGGPIRFLIPDVTVCGIGEVDACANVKFLSSIEASVGRGPDSRPAYA